MQDEKQQTKNLEKNHKKKISKQNMQQNCFQQQVTDTAELIPIRLKKKLIYIEQQKLFAEQQTNSPHQHRIIPSKDVKNNHA